ncbi:TlpA family protein disulfide reductase [Pedobacter chinensis]|nr:TlpA disulfide reductase family protein [Pedobacter chinensis]
MMRLRYFDDYLVENVLVFKNTSQYDTVISRKIVADKILEFRYSLMDLAKDKAYFYMFYAEKGTVLNLKLENFELIDLDHKPYLFVSNFLDIDNSMFSNNKNGNFADLYDGNEHILYRNFQIIDSLQLLEKIDGHTVSLWKEIVNNFYIERLTRLNYTDHTTYIDSLTKKLEKLLLQKTETNSPALASAIYSLIHYSQIKNKVTDNIYTSLIEIIKLNTEKRYKCGIAFNLLHNFPEKSSALYLKSYELFKNNLPDSNFQDQEYAKAIIPNQKTFDRSIIKLFTINNAVVTLDDVFKKHKGKIIMFDFWATWCIPCIEEMLYLEITKKKFLNKNIVFISIALDKDVKSMEWKNLSARLKITGDQYRVIEKSNKAISNYYGIVIIPKYMLFDQKGMLINDDFVKPSDKSFDEKILKYVN